MLARVLNVLTFFFIVLAGTRAFAADTRQQLDVRLQAYQALAATGDAEPEAGAGRKVDGNSPATWRQAPLVWLR